MKLNLISDLHGHLPEMPDADVTFIAGDICPYPNHAIGFQKRWVDTEFRAWLESFGGEKVGILGNHDFLGEKETGRDLLNDLPWQYLDNGSTHVNGLKVWGSPYSNKFGGWAFMTSEDALRGIVSLIPRDVDVILFHGPPHGYGDLVPGATWSAVKRGWVDLEGRRVGSTSLSNSLIYDTWPNLKLLVTGHIHESRGFYPLKDFTIVNAAYLDGQYQPYEEDIIQFDLEGS